nr:FGGY-family carbohydrate kinase [Chelativorans petroleitrophicus]
MRLAEAAQPLRRIVIAQPAADEIERLEYSELRLDAGEDDAREVPRAAVIVRDDGGRAAARQIEIDRSHTRRRTEVADPVRVRRARGDEKIHLVGHQQSRGLQLQLGLALDAGDDGKQAARSVPAPWTTGPSRRRNASTRPTTECWPGMWLNEGGQSAVGAAIEQLLSFYPAAQEAARMAKEVALSLPAWLSEKARQGSKNLSETVLLARGLDVVPEFLGNRAPFADPHARAVIAGLSMERDVASLVALYIAGVCGLGYGLRQILETQDAAGVRVERIMISGGAGQDPLGRQILADATRRPMLASRVDEPVLLGSAILGAVAAGLYPDIVTAMQAMSGVSATYTPAAGVINAVHESRYRAFLSLQKAARDIRTSEAGRKVE